MARPNSPQELGDELLSVLNPLSGKKRNVPAACIIVVVVVASAVVVVLESYYFLLIIVDGGGHRAERVSSRRNGHFLQKSLFC
jgi:hypothetical protein